VKAGRLRPLATTGLKRAAQMPDVPTLKEVGIDVEVTVRYGIFAPAATPRDVVNTLATAIAKAARSPDMRQRLLDQGAEPVGNSPEAFAKIMQEEVVRWAEVVRVSGAKAD
jgi:tripartite-type tricarboxylate transporter receptor subunit TctC